MNIRFGNIRNLISGVGHCKYIFKMIKAMKKSNSNKDININNLLIVEIF